MLALNVGFLAVLSKYQVYAVVGALRCFDDSVALAFVGFGGEGFKLAPGEAADVGERAGWRGKAFGRDRRLRRAPPRLAMAGGRQFQIELFCDS